MPDKQVEVVRKNIKNLRVGVYPPEGRVRVACTADASLDARTAQLDRWYRKLLREKAKPSLEKWSRQLGVAMPVWGVRRMKTKWGSCNPEHGRVWINVELAKKPLQCLDYVILHEMAHFVSPKHDDLFVSTLNKHMPDWRMVRSDLNSYPLTHEQPSFDRVLADKRRLSSIP